MLFRSLDSLLKAKALSSDLKLFFVDNHSSDQTVELLTAYEKKDDFSRFEIIQQEQNQGFGNANNLGASFGKDEIVCFLNVVVGHDKEHLAPFGRILKTEYLLPHFGRNDIQVHQERFPANRFLLTARSTFRDRKSTRLNSSHSH